jgi:hypothetical protein
MLEASTGEPDGKWKAWIKWLRLAGVVAAGTWLLRLSEQDLAILLVLAVVLAVMCFRLRLTEQRIELLVDGHPVQLKLYTDVSRRVWLEALSEGRLERSCIMQAYHQGWLDHALALGGKRYALRIFVKTHGDGYLVSNKGRGFDMVVVRNTWAG